jgi:hypothetical protein
VNGDGGAGLVVVPFGVDHLSMATDQVLEESEIKRIGEMKYCIPAV